MMSTAGRIVIDAAGIILESDEIFSAMMHESGSLIGVNALEITAIGDRDRCGKIVAQIIADGRAVGTEKRLTRADGSNFWVRNQLRSIGTVDEPRIEIHLEPSLPLKDGMSPAKLLRVARLAFDGRRSRTRAFGQNLFTDHAWDLLLSAYICEAEGSFITIARAHAWAGISLTTASRWIRALASEGLLEYENGGNSALVTTPFRLTAVAHHKFEIYLSDLYEKGANGREIALS
uniref:PAS domain-containing protein n=1 Tax=Sphingomonas sp. TaxID=28214 RepID=UPI0025D869D4|nr:PAS domain-containing protein [Sphingomonas sp.]